MEGFLMKFCTIGIILVISLLCMAESCFAVNNTSSLLSSPQPGYTPDMRTSVGSGIYEFRCNVEGATVFLDGKNIGTITGGILQVPIPVYDHLVQRQLRMEAPGYSAYNEILLQNPKVGETMIVRGKLQVLPFNLTGSLSLAISPPGGQVSIDDISMGVVDQSGIMTFHTVKSGNRIVKVTLPGYKNYEQQITVASNLVTKMRIALLPLTTGTLQISSVPSGAQINLNGSPYGITPVTALDLEQGIYTIECSLPGFQIYKSQVVLSPGQNIPVSAILQPVPTPTPTLVPATHEPTPIPTQAGLAPVIAIIGMFAVLCLNYKKK
jgi:hypothetical protein